MAENPYTGPFGHETLSFKTKGAGRTDEVTLDLTYEATQNKAQSDAGAYQVIAATGTFTVLNKDGSVKATHPITELLRRAHVGDDDDRIYPDSHKISTVVDRLGLSFRVAEPTKAAPNQSLKYNFFHSAKGAGYQLYTPYDNETVDRSSIKLTGGLTTKTKASSQKAESDAAVSPVCFASGTRLRTSRGDIAVESLAVGDLVVTSSGALRPVRWLGHRTIDCRRHPRPALVLPIRIAAHAFGTDLPARDLVVSPGHAICVDMMGEVLIPASALVNGTTVVREDCARVTYWHVELESHDIVLAENLAAESYLEMGNRDFFSESGTVALAAAPDAAVRTHADFCRPFHGAGPVVEAVRARLAARAAATVGNEDVRAA